MRRKTPAAPVRPGQLGTPRPSQQAQERVDQLATTIRDPSIKKL